MPPAADRAPAEAPPDHPGPLHALLGQAMRYGVIGIGNAAITLIVLNGLVYFGEIEGGPALLGANAIAVSISMVNSYIWNSRYTFESGQMFHGRLMARFTLVNLSGFAVNQAVFAAVAYPLLDLTDLHRNAASSLAQGAAICVHFVWNFLWLRFWAYRVAPGGGIPAALRRE